MNAMEDGALAWRIEEACLNAWPALRSVLYGGWVLRFSGGLTRRANSANAVSRVLADSGPFFADVEALYRHHRQPAIYRLTSLIRDNIDGQLAARGYSDEGSSCVLYRHLDSAPGPFDPAVRLQPRPTREWLAAMAALQCHNKGEATLYRRIVGAVAVPAAFAVLVEGDRCGVAALAYGAIHRQILCYVSLVTDPQQRRRGHARRVVETLAAWGAEHGAHAACLEVEAGNAPALALYDRLGFRELYRYHYRRQPPF